MWRPTIFSSKGAVQIVVFLLVPAGLCAAGKSQSIAPIDFGAKQAADSLLQSFGRPPLSARPQVWWHWMKGNVTKQGVGLDLDWMSRIGLGGFAVFQGSLDVPQIVPHRLEYMSPEWQAAFRGALDDATRRGLEVTIASCPGWSSSGGPWVKPEEAMQKLVWSSVDVAGGSRFHAALPPLPHATGTFGNYELPRNKALPLLPTFSREVAVLAYRMPEAEVAQGNKHATVSSVGGTVDMARLADDDVQTPAAVLEEVPDASITFDYGSSQRIAAVTLATTDDIASIFGFDDPHSIAAVLQRSDDGKNFEQVTEIGHSSIPQRTKAFPAVSARYFRVLFPPIGREPHKITELVLHANARTNEWEKRAGFATVPNYYEIVDEPTASGEVVQPSEVIDLSDKLQTDGVLDWNAPAGRWRVVRFGSSLVGRENEPAPLEATGLEVDKLNPRYVRRYIETYLATYQTAVGSALLGKTGITHLVTDSIEFGAQNWTDDMLPEFQRLRGYDPRPWLPALTGMVVGSTAETDRFLYDFRTTIADLFAANYYGVIANALHERGLRYYSEALEFRRPSLGDDMQMRSFADIPMAAMWTFDKASGPNPTYVADVRGAASVAHVYGKRLTAAESMTAGPPPWSWSPARLKPIADLEFALGVNRIEIHESTHQPLINKAPGLTLGEFGQWFNRNETWAEQAKPWVDYLARSSFMLQQGKPQVDIAYFYGEEAPLTGLFGLHPQRDPAEGYAFDFVNADILLHRMRVQRGRLSTGVGNSYRMLFLGGTSYRMTLPVLRKLVELVRAGATVVGARPVDSPSLADDQTRFQLLADKLWPLSTDGTFHALGKGRVYPGRDLEGALRVIGLQRDFDYRSSQPGAKLLFVHRRTMHEDIYFVTSRSDLPLTAEVTLRVAGRRAAWWDAATGTSEPISYQQKAASTRVILHLDPYGAGFVVLRPGGAKHFTEPARHERTLATGDPEGGWRVQFESGRGAPAHASFSRLQSWSFSEDPGIRYFSGTAIYSRRISVAASDLHRSGRLWLDLGQVKELASVTVNGKPLGIAWKPPFRVDVTGVLHPGENELAIAVTNLWVNRLIGDAQPRTAEKYTFTTLQPYRADAPLLPSGLLGPVRLVAEIPETPRRRQ